MIENCYRESLVLDWPKFNKFVPILRMTEIAFLTSQFQNDILRRYYDSEEDEEDYDYEDGNLSFFF